MRSKKRSRVEGSGFTFSVFKAWSVGFRVSVQAFSVLGFGAGEELDFYHGVHRGCSGGVFGYGLGICCEGFGLRSWVT